ncbi:MAG: 50S ribosomal protein L6 [Candidatus Saccharimonadales bacterium]
MSRIGKLPILVPTGVAITVDSDVITVSGPKGTLKQAIMAGITVKQENANIIVTRVNDNQDLKAKHGLMRSLINNMVAGVNQGFSKKLEINGVGYRVVQQGSDLKLNLGFSHDIIYHIPVDIMAGIDQNVITISGINKQQVGQVAAEIRSLKKPEPYKGKGVKYVGEHIIRKSGKAGKEK